MGFGEVFTTADRAQRNSPPEAGWTLLTRTVAQTTYGLVSSGALEQTNPGLLSWALASLVEAEVGNAYYIWLSEGRCKSGGSMLAVTLLFLTPPFRN